SFRNLAILAVLAALPLSAADLIVAAASDLTTLESELSIAFKTQTGIRVRFSFGSSGNLARQIENGAPFDVFLSANELYVSQLASTGQLDPASIRTYAFGRLALWSKSAEFKQLDQLAAAKVRHIAIANPAHAPYGVAARQALEKAGTWKAVEPRIV